MGATTGISWADATFNPWLGCTKVSVGCAHCYAERDAARFGLAEWGPQAARRITSASYWRQPHLWNRKAQEAGHRTRVFCGSMCDVFEERPELEAPRSALFELIDETPYLIWMLLTKRPENVQRMMSWANWPANVWLGTSVENQATAARRIPTLLGIDATLRFLSCEPLLGSIDFGQVHSPATPAALRGIAWCIIGGESGSKHRAMELAWLVEIVEQCHSGGVPVFVKQDAGQLPGMQGRIPDELWIQELPVEANHENNNPHVP